MQYIYPLYSFSKSDEVDEAAFARAILTYAISLSFSIYEYLRMR